MIMLDAQVILRRRHSATIALRAASLVLILLAANELAAVASRGGFDFISAYFHLKDHAFALALKPLAVVILLGFEPRLVRWLVPVPRPGGCPNCGYDLAGGTADRCPECGLRLGNPRAGADV